MGWSKQPYISLSYQIQITSLFFFRVRVGVWVCWGGDAASLSKVIVDSVSVNARLLEATFSATWVYSVPFSPLPHNTRSFPHSIYDSEQNKSLDSPVEHFSESKVRENFSYVPPFTCLVTSLPVNTFPGKAKLRGQRPSSLHAIPYSLSLHWPSLSLS